LLIQYIVLALIPVVLLLSFLYITDRFNKEPAKLLLKLFILGFLSAAPIVLLENILSSFNIFSGIVAYAFESFFVAGFIEELFKRKIVLKFAYNNVAFDEKLDGIIYCAFTSLGFAAIENILYIAFQTESFTNIALTRGLLSVPAHMLFAITMGYYLSLAKFSDNKRKKDYYMRRALIEPIILHGLYDFILMTNANFLFVFIPYMFFLWFVNMKKLNKLHKLSKEQYKKDNKKLS